MKKFLFVIFASACLTVTNAQVKTPSDHMIYEKQVGYIKIGEHINSVLNLKKWSVKKEMIGGEGGDYAVYELYNKSGDKLEVEMGYDLETEKFTKIINRIIVKSSNYKTCKNIGANSTLEKFAKAYPDYKITFSTLNGLILSSANTPDIKFALNLEDVSDMYNLKVQDEEDAIELRKEDFKPSSKIAFIQIGSYNF